jgi:anaerobic selenocysteine-containing dehydrogenase
MALIHVILAEGLTDADYVASTPSGSTNWPSGRRTARRSGVLRRPHPGRGHPHAGPRVRRRAAVDDPDRVAIERSSGGGQTVRAISCLPGLVGAWRRPGGGLLALPLWAFPVDWDALSRPDLLRPGTRVVNQYHLGRALSGEMGLDPGVHALVVYNANPVIVCPDQARLLAGLAREDLFTVVSEQFMTDTALYADIVLPATTQLEQLDVMFSWGPCTWGSTGPRSRRSGRPSATPSCSAGSPRRWASRTTASGAPTSR